MRHQWASVHELARIEMLAGLPGETLAKLAGEMERRTLSPGEIVDVEGQLVAVLSGLAHVSSGSQARRTAEPGSVLDEAALELHALTPVTLARCDRAVFEALVDPASES